MTISKETLEALAKVDVLSNTPTDLLPENVEIEKKIRTIKDSTFTLKLTQQQVETLERFAKVKQLPNWQAYLTQEIQEQILKQEGKIGKALINTPSFASSGKVTGPSYQGLVTRG